MKIDDLQLHESASKAIAAYGQYAAKPQGSSVSASKSGLFVDLASSPNEITSYGRQKQSPAQLAETAGLTDAKDKNKQLLICASTMSGEDYKKMVEEGVRPDEYDPADTVTIMDHIKAAVAKGGTVVSGFNAEGDMDLEKLTELTGSVALAKELAGAFSEKDLPLSEETAKDVMTELSRCEELTELTDGMKQYMLENHISPTIDGLYLARYSGGAFKSAGAGYFAEDLSGYIGKNAGSADYQQLLPQLEKVIENASLPVTEETKAQCLFLMDAGIPLTPENLTALTTLESISLPPEKGRLLSCITDAYCDGLTAKDADLTGRSLTAKAEELTKAVAQISDQAVEKVISENESFTIRSLSAAQRELSVAAGSLQSIAGAPADAGKILEGQRLLTEVRLQMSTHICRNLLAEGFAVDTTELSALADKLRDTQESLQKTWGLSLPDAKENDLLIRTQTVRSDLYEMPAAILGGIKDSAKQLTLTRVHELGTLQKETFQKAGESYEALMTAPRADLGDRITKAFANVDVLLEEQGFTPTEDNRRAVRILGYNRMEITKENIESVRAADATVTGLLEKMNPAATLQMIRDGINPLEKSLGELDAYFTGQSLSAEGQNEKFSRFLYELEQKSGISDDERQTYMGIYRLLHQIEKDDGKVIGTVVANGQSLTFSNLLSAARTFQKGGISQTVDDSFGGVNAKNERSISAQIETYYAKKAGQLTGVLTPELLSSKGADFDMLLDELIDAAVIQDTLTAEEYAKESLAGYREALTDPEEAAALLMENEIASSADNLLAAKQLLKDRSSAFRSMKNLAAKIDEATAAGSEEARATDILDELLSLPLAEFTDRDHASAAYERFADSASSYLSEQIHETDADYLDVKSLKLCGRMLSVMSRMSRQENYELPAVIDGQLVAVNIRFEAGKTGTPHAGMQIALSETRIIKARFSMQGDVLTGVVGVTEEDLQKGISEKLPEFAEKFLAETGKKADISIVYSDTLPAAPHAEGEKGSGETSVMYQASKLFIEALGRI